MSSSEMVTAHHLARKAMIYVRQSSPHQVLTNQESLKLQYALRERALELGWRGEDIEVVDSDLGITGKRTEPREGFKGVVAEVSLGHVGIIFSTEVMRLARNCSDWYPLLDICGYKGCLIADRDGIYDPSTSNGRLLLGIKGTLSEVELHTIRERMTSGLLNKARRGELALHLPTGLVPDETGVVRKDTNLEVQHRIGLVFDTFLRLRSASKVLQLLNAHELLLPCRDRFGDIIWKKPTIAAILCILKNPAYAGTFVYGRTRSTHTDPARIRTSVKNLPIQEWRIRVNDKYPAYVSWEDFERIQAMLKDNYAEYDRNKTRGIPRTGKALLHGLVYYGECGHKMVVQYKAGTRYLCNYLRQQYRVPVCQYIPADPVDDVAVRAFFEALSSVELDAYSRAMASRRRADEQVERAREQQLERLCYQAELAYRQFNRVDPDNRLVAGELERRWELALRELKQAEDAYAQAQRDDEAPLELPEGLKEVFMTVGQRLPEIWDTDVLTQQQRKALLRALIDKVVVQRYTPDQLQVRIVWKGAEMTVHQVPVSVGSLAELGCANEMERKIVEMFSVGRSDEEIAEQLTSEGHRSPMRTYVLTSTVKTIRLRRRLLRERSQSHPRHVAGYLTVSQLAQAVGVSHHWLYDRIHNSRIEVERDVQTGLYLFLDDPATIRMIQDLKDGKLKKLRFSKEHQHA